MSAQVKTTLLVLLTMAGIISVMVIKPIGQDPHYHLFADTRSYFSIPNFWNVFTNLPFLLIGIAGMYATFDKKASGVYTQLRINTLVFFIGIFLTGIGSAYYHYYPNTQTLFWDRLPMTISFMSFFSIIIGEYISLKAARVLLPQLLLAGVFSILYWNMTERLGHGDLRFYALIQFLPMLLIPFILLLYKSNFNTNLYMWLMALAYLAAKIFEYADVAVFSCGGLVSGHSLKHICAALAPAIYLVAMYKRRALTQQM